jgi:hypothetical protein
MRLFERWFTACWDSELRELPELDMDAAAHQTGALAPA